MKYLNLYHVFYKRKGVNYDMAKIPYRKVEAESKGEAIRSLHDELERNEPGAYNVPHDAILLEDWSAATSVSAYEFLESVIPDSEGISVFEKLEQNGIFWTPAHSLEVLYNHREKKYNWEYDLESKSTEGVQDEKGFRLAWLRREVNNYRKGLQEGKWGSYTVVINQYIQKRNNEINGKPELRFEDLFVNREHASTLDFFMENSELLTNGRFTGSSGNKTELAALYWVLHTRKIIKKGKFATQARVFHSHYRLELGKDVSMQNAREEKVSKSDYKEFERLLLNLFN